MNMILRLSCIALSLLYVTACSSGDKNKNAVEKRGRVLDYTEQVTFLNDKSEKIISIEVAVADEPQERNTGLMDVNNLPQNKGMLFIFEENQPRSFWMVNTPLSLDIMFVNADKEIVRIHQNTQPFSEKNLSSGDPAKYVIETNGGFSLSHDIREGMKVAF